MGPSQHADLRGSDFFWGAPPDHLVTGSGLRARDIEDATVFVCAHLQRDARCGHCGPELSKAAQSLVATGQAHGKGCPGHGASPHPPPRRGVGQVSLSWLVLVEGKRASWNGCFQVWHVFGLSNNHGTESNLRVVGQKLHRARQLTRPPPAAGAGSRN